MRFAQRILETRTLDEDIWPLFLSTALIVAAGIFFKLLFMR